MDPLFPRYKICSSNRYEGSITGIGFLFYSFTKSLGSGGGVIIREADGLA